MIPVFIPHAGCPHRCVFCDQAAITGRSADPSAGIPDAAALDRRVDAFRRHSDPRRRPVEIAFFGGTFLGLDPAVITALLAAADRHVRCGTADGIRFSTRPDTVDEQTLALIRPHAVRTVELGVQSMDDRVLALSRRGHRAADTRRAAALLRDAGYALGFQMMLGLPGDTPARRRAGARAVESLQPDFVRIYPTVVLAGSLLARAYRQGRYRPLSVAAAVQQAKELVVRFEARGIPVVRVGLQSTADLRAGGTVLAGPHHPALGHLVRSALMFDRCTAALQALDRVPAEVTLVAHPRSLSRVRGPRNANLEALRRRFDLKAVDCRADERLGDTDVHLVAGVAPHRRRLRRSGRSRGVLTMGGGLD